MTFFAEPPRPEVCAGSTCSRYPRVVDRSDPHLSTCTQCGAFGGIPTEPAKATWDPEPFGYVPYDGRHWTSDRCAP